ncbi:MAG: hypothetical protein AB7V26_04015 [Lysobacterales bacterium]
MVQQEFLSRAHGGGRGTVVKGSDARGQPDGPGDTPEQVSGMKNGNQPAAHNEEKGHV